MPAPFKPRRRGPSGPNKNERKLLRRAQAEREARSAGVLKEKFPSVTSLTLQLTHFNPQQVVYEEKRRSMGPDDACDFLVPCPGRCGGDRGTYDLSKEIRGVVESRRERADGRHVCQEIMNIGTAGTCDFRLDWSVVLAYAPE
jgi:hypothetical protein